MPESEDSRVLADGGLVDLDSQDAPLLRTDQVAGETHPDVDSGASGDANAFAPGVVVGELTWPMEMADEPLGGFAVAAALHSGGLAVVWMVGSAEDAAPGESGVMAAIFDSAGAAIEMPFWVSPMPPTGQFEPFGESLSALPLEVGGFLVAWGEESSGHELVYTVVVDEAGIASDEPQVVAEGFQPRLADNGGQVLLVWSDFPGSIYAQRLGETGEPIGTSVVVNESFVPWGIGTGGVTRNAVSVAPDGMIFVAWQHVWDSAPCDCAATFGRWLGNDLSPLGEVILLAGKSPLLDPAWAVYPAVTAFSNRIAAYFYATSGAAWGGSLSADILDDEAVLLDNESPEGSPTQEVVAISVPGGFGLVAWPDWNEHVEGRFFKPPLEFVSPVFGVEPASPWAEPVVYAPALAVMDSGAVAVIYSTVRDVDGRRVLRGRLIASPAE